MSDEKHEGRPSKRQRFVTKRSCTECVQAHLSCDRGRPNCGNCSRKQKTCVYLHGGMAPIAGAFGVLPEMASLSPLAHRDLSGLSLPSIQGLFVQQNQLIAQQQALIENLRELVAGQYSKEGSSPSDPSTPGSSSSDLSSPYHWDPNETDLHYLQCQAKLMWDRFSDPETAMKHIFALLQDFIHANPGRMILLIRFDELHSRMIAISPALLDFTQMSPEFMQQCFSQRINPFSSESRTNSLNHLICRYLTNVKAGHTFLYERSSEIFLKGKRMTASFFTSLFYDPSDQLFGILGLLTPHASLQPIVKPVILNSHCFTCSKATPSSFKLIPLPHSYQSELQPDSPFLLNISDQSNNTPTPTSSQQAPSASVSSEIHPVAEPANPSSSITSLSMPPDQFGFDHDFPPSLCHLFIGGDS